MRAPATMNGLREAARVLVPVACPGCGLEDVRWCEACAAPWWEDAWRAEAEAPRLDVDGRPPLPVWVLTPLAGTAHGMIGAWKDGGRRDLDRFFQDAASRLGEQVSERLATLPAPFCVVPAPARAASTRRRGQDLPLLLARAVAAGASRDGRHVVTHPCLSVGAGDQRGTSASERWRGMQGSVRLAGPPPAGMPVLLIDDVVTTGATLAACVRALEDVGCAVVGAAALAAVGRVAVRARPGLR